MKTTIGSLLLAALAALTSTLAADDASACGGCFHAEEQTPEQASVVTAHRMALAISPTRTVLWDQVEYSGSPAEFAWVLPVRDGARIEVGTDAWFETLDAATDVRVNAPQLDCGGGDGDGFACGPPGAVGCSADAADGSLMEAVQEPDPVTVVHRGSAGPYETVTLHADVPGALTTWLTDNGFAIDADIQPIIDAYVADGFDFIALRLLPDIGVQQMKPVRVIQPGAVPTLPLRMVAAGTGANVALTLFVIGEGRWATENFPAAAIDRSRLSWDFNAERSNYTSLRQEALEQQDGRAWLTSYAQKGALLSPITNPISGGVISYAVGYTTAFTIGEAFVDQGLSNGETASSLCKNAFADYATSSWLVVDPCDEAGVCAEVAPDEIDARELACAELDDLAVALVGMHPRDVWLTRLEADLPRAALGDDLSIAPTAQQVDVSNWISAPQATNAPCAVAGTIPPRPASAARRPLRGAAYALIGSVLALALGMRRLRRASRLPARAV